MLPQAPARHHDGDGGFGDEVVGEGAEEDSVKDEKSVFGHWVMYLWGRNGWVGKVGRK